MTHHTLRLLITLLALAACTKDDGADEGPATGALPPISYVSTNPSQQREEAVDAAVTHGLSSFAGHLTPGQNPFTANAGACR